MLARSGCYSGSVEPNNAEHCFSSALGATEATLTVVRFGAGHAGPFPRVADSYRQVTPTELRMRMAKLQTTPFGLETTAISPG